MADPTTTNIVLAVPTHGSDVDTWDQPLNANAGILDAIAGSVTSKSLTNANVVLSTSETRVSILRFTGVLTGNCGIFLGAIIKSWICENNTTGAFFVQIIGNGGLGNRMSLPPGTSQIYWDGSNVNFINLGKVGEYWDYAGATVPLWVAQCTVPPYLLCDGSSFSAVTYPLLNQILGGTTLPDFRGRSRSFLNGGTSRITSVLSGIDGNSLLSGGGDQTITIGQVNLPAVAPTFTGTLITPAATVLNSAVPSPSGTTVAPAASGIFGTGSSFTPTVTIAPFTPAGTISNLGSGTALASMPPTCIGGITMIRAA